MLDLNKLSKAQKLMLRGITYAAEWLKSVGYATRRFFKRAIGRHQFQQELSKLSPTDFAAKWLSEPTRYLLETYVGEFAPCIPPRQMLEAIFKDRNTTQTDQVTHRPTYFKCVAPFDYAYSKYPIIDHWQAYQQARENHLESQRKWALVKTLLSGLLITPLLFTIPFYKKIASQGVKEKQEMEKITRDFYAHRDPHYSYGMILLEECNVTEAMQNFSKVSKRNKHYRDAMSELGHAHLASGNANEAVSCFKKSKESRAQFIAEMLAANPNLTLGDINPVVTKPKQEQEQNSLAPTVASSADHNTALRRSGIFPQPEKAKGLDEDESNPQAFQRYAITPDITRL